MTSVIKEFLAFAKNCGENEENIIQSLQVLSVVNDLSIFEPGSFEVGEFYSTLHEVLSHAVSQPGHEQLIWSVVSVLQVALRNPGACTALGHTYHFITPLTSVLDTRIPTQKQLTVLKIVQELSYGIIIRWQEAHLPRLIQILLDLIKSSDCELVQVALSVLVNLCHKNKPVVYTLMNTVNIKAFMRTIFNLQRENMETRVQVCKLVMVLDELNGGIPESDILQFVKVSFISINKAFALENTCLMRHVVDFFHDAKESKYGKKVLLTYPDYPEGIDTVMKTLRSKEPPNNWKCVRHLMEFILLLVDLELPSMLSSFTKLSCHVLPWIRVPGVSQVALDLLSAVLKHSEKTHQNIYAEMCSTIEDNLEILVNMLDDGCKSKSRTCEEENILTSLLHFLTKLASNEGLVDAIVNRVDKEEVKNLLLPLVSQSPQDGSSIFRQSVIALYVEVLHFISRLSKNNKDWLFLYSDLLHKKQILKAFAIGLYFGSYEVKKTILFLAGTASFSKECITTLSKSLSHLSENQLGVGELPVETTVKLESNSIECSHFPNPPPSVGRVDQDSLNNIIEKLQDLIDKNQVQDLSLAGVIELYNYKLSEMQRAERSLHCSLAAADRLKGQLTGRVAHLATENTRLHQLLYNNQLVLENTTKELADLRDHLATAQMEASSMHVKYKQLKQDAQSKSLIVKEQSEEISNMKAHSENLKGELRKLEEVVKKITGEKETQNKVLLTLEAENSDKKAASQRWRIKSKLWRRKHQNRNV